MKFMIYNADAKHLYTEFVSEYENRPVSPELTLKAVELFINTILKE
ncbi:hypothetical protein [Elizabethkingia anophelis]|nr:hypothetical protein [Elizabethkingia anophelis]MCT4285632.1 hypothetical protein [Elizabethkingia anophelis]